VLIAFSLFGLATLTRPVFLFFPALVFILVVVAAVRQKLPALKNIFKPVMAVVIYTVIVGSWCYRNYRIFGTFELNTGHSAILFDYGAVKIEIMDKGVSFNEAQRMLTEQLRRSYAGEIDSLNAVQKSRVVENFAIRYIAGHPLLFMILAVKNIPLVFMPQFESLFRLMSKNEIRTTIVDTYWSEGIRSAIRSLLSFDKVLLALTLLMAVVLIAIYTASIVGFIAHIKHGYFGRASVLLLLAGLYLLLVPIIIGFIGIPRFRVPFVPIIAFFGGYGIMSMTGRGRMVSHN
jgi:4-amino-4-deoxy-L-arabinose transferase-like glycosyltransferase